MSKKILIVSFAFPPSPGVGGRRWSKFAKFLNQDEEIHIHVISSKTQIKNKIKTANVRIKNHITLPTNYPKYLEHAQLKKNTLINKIMFKVQHYFIKKKVKGNYWDLSVFWNSHFLNTIPELIKKENISKLIISGPPFRYVEYAVKLKTIISELEIILDIRDPWNWVDVSNPNKLEKSRYDFEVNLEKEMLKKVDKIITVSDFQKSLILKREPDAAPIFVIPNGFDSDDYKSIEDCRQQSNLINLTHFGTLHQQKYYYWKPFFSAFSKLKSDHPEIYAKIRINLVGYTPPEIKNFIKQHCLKVNMHGILSQKQALNLLSHADIALWFKYDESPGDFATKFGDYIALNKFQWVFSMRGAVTELIEKEKIGKVFYRNSLDLENQIYNEFLQLENSKNRSYNSNFNSSKLDLKNLTEELIKVLDLN